MPSISRSLPRRAVLTGTGVTVAGAAIPGVLAGNADAELIRLCSRHIANHHAINTGPDDIDDDGGPWRAYSETLNALKAADAHTLAGMRAKALAAKAEAMQPGGTEDPRCCPAEDIAWDIVNDLLRFTETAGVLS